MSNGPLSTKREKSNSRIPVPIFSTRNISIYKRENKKPPKLLQKEDAHTLKASENSNRCPDTYETILKTKVANSKCVQKCNEITELQKGKFLTKSVQNRIENQTAAKFPSHVFKKETLAAKSTLLKKGTSQKENIKSLKSSDCSKTTASRNFNSRPLHTAVNVKLSKDIKQTSLKNMSENGAKNNRNVLCLGKATEFLCDKKLEEPKAPSKLCEKENKLPYKQSPFVYHNDIKFEANEMFRKMILSERVITPNRTGSKLSFISSERPSLYGKMLEMPADPLTVLKDACSSLKRDRKASLVNQGTVINAFQSPCSERFSFYTPCADPGREVMKSLEALKARKKLKNAMKNEKKVSFNFNVEESLSKENINVHQTPFTSSEFRLSNINEKSEKNTPDSPPIKISDNSLVKHDDKQSTTFLKQISTFEHEQITVSKLALETNSNSNLCTPVAKSLPISRDMHRESITANFVNTNKEITDTIFQSLRKLDSKFFSPNSTCGNNSVYDTSVRKENFRDDNRNWDKFTGARLYTPRPISFFSKSSLGDISSPEFLTDADNNLLADSAPIYTPFVLRSMAKCSVQSPEADLSPVRLKLNFTEDDKDSPKKDGPTKSYTNLSLEKIATHQKMLEHMADKECSLWLRNERISVVCGRYLQNPVALTLTEGDDMHFIPIKF